MVQFFTILSLSTVGSVVSVGVSLALRAIARGTENETLRTGPGRSDTSQEMAQVDPVVTFGFTLSCYGAVALALVGALPGPLALDRTVLAFALLCVGGLIGEISSTGSTEPLQNLDSHGEDPPTLTPISLPLSIALAIVLNCTFAVLSFGQGLIDIVPPAALADGHLVAELDPVTVIAARPPRDLLPPP